MEEHIRELIDNIGLEELFEQLSIDPAVLIAEMIAEARAELPPGLEIGDFDGEEL